MKLFLISQNVNNGYDTYDSAVVAAESAVEARHTHPSNFMEYVWNSKGNTWGIQKDNGEFFNINHSDWAHPDDVNVKCLAVYEGERGVICASFNAG